MFRSLKYGALAVGLVTLAGAFAAVTGPVVALPGGYYLQPDKAFHTLIVDRKGHRVLQGTVAAYAVFRTVTAGAEGDPPSGSAGSDSHDLPYTGTADTHYFVLDGDSGRIDQHMTEDAWHRRLQELEVPQDFRIYPPIRWQQLR